MGAASLHSARESAAQKDSLQAARTCTALVRAERRAYGYPRPPCQILAATRGQMRGARADLALSAAKISRRVFQLCGRGRKKARPNSSQFA